MDKPIPGALRYDVDQLVISGRRLFGWGWIAHRDRTVRALHLEVEGNGWRKRLPVTRGYTRDDVAQAFPEFREAGSSGFVVTGFVPDYAPRRFSLQVTFDDGGQSTLELERVVQSAAQRLPAHRSLRRLARGLMRRIRARDFSDVFRAGRERNQPVLDAEPIADALVGRLQNARAVRMIFDHDMGGGANHYRRSLIARWLAAGDAVVLCTYHLPALDYRFHLMAGDERVQFLAPSFLVLGSVIQRTPVVELFVNSPVSFDDPMMLADWLAGIRATHPNTRLTVAMHDFFPVCPSFVLLNAEGRYCGIPGPDECARCLARHEGAHVALSPPAQIGPWRDAWGRCLRAADEVRCFSESTRRLLPRAHAHLERMSLVPHEPDFVPSRLPRVDPAAPLVIGVLGTISEQKGASVVTELAKRIELARLPVRVVVLGTLDGVRAVPSLRVAGPYERCDLPDLIEQHGINLFLFPSIWPETFSFVVAEMMALGLPIVAFDLGAPAERLRDYRLARLVRPVSADAALEAVLDFHRDLASRAAHPA